MKIRRTDYTFNASARTITFAGAITLDQLLLITNVTDNVIIYNFADPTLGGSLVGDVLTLVYNTTSMSNTDVLQIFVEDGIITQPVSVQSSSLPTGASTSTAQATGNASLASIDGKLTNPLPVSGPATDAQLRATPLPISVASLPLPSSAATAARQDTGNASLASIDSKLTNPLPVSGPLTDAQLRAADVPVSGPLTDTQLRASAVPVSGPLTDQQLRTSPVSVTLNDVEGNPIVPNKEITQQDIQDIIESIQEMVSQLKFLSGVRGIAADLRVTLLSGVVTTVSTVTTVTTVSTVTSVTTVATVSTVTNLAQIGAQPAQQIVPAIQNQLVQLGNVANTSGY